MYQFKLFFWVFEFNHIQNFLLGNVLKIPFMKFSNSNYSNDTVIIKLTINNQVIMLTTTHGCNFYIVFKIFDFAREFSPLLVRVQWPEWVPKNKKPNMFLSTISLYRNNNVINCKKKIVTVIRVRFFDLEVHSCTLRSDQIHKILSIWSVENKQNTL